MIARAATAGCLAAALLLVAPLPLRAQWISPTARVVSINLRNQSGGVVEVRFDHPICYDKPQSPELAIVRSSSSAGFSVTVSILIAALLGNHLVSIQADPETCDIQAVWVKR
jgi:hypothetical protein